MTDPKHDCYPIRTECATDIAVLKRDMADTRADVAEIHQLFVRNGFAKTVAQNTANVKNLWWAIGILIGLMTGGISGVIALYLEIF